MSKIQLNKNQKEVLFIVALFLVPFLDPGFALLLGLILSLTIGHRSGHQQSDHTYTPPNFRRGIRIRNECRGSHRSG